MVGAPQFHHYNYTNMQCLCSRHVSPSQIDLSVLCSTNVIYQIAHPSRQCPRCWTHVHCAVFIMGGTTNILLSCCVAQIIFIVALFEQVTEAVESGNVFPRAALPPG
jgi:hypothetical protein